MLVASVGRSRWSWWECRKNEGKPLTDPVLKTIFTANGTEAEKVVAGLERKVEGLIQQQKRLGQTSKETGGTNPFMGMVAGAASAVAQIASVGGALALLKQGYDDVADRQRKAFDTQKGVAGALEGMAINIDVPLAEAEAEARRISKKTGVELGRVMASIGAAFSAKGQLGKADAFAAVETTAELVPNVLDAQDLLAGATLDLRKFDPNITSKQAQGFLMRGMVQARITELRSMAEHGAPAITGMAMLDRENPEALTEAAGIYGAITQGMRDPHGRKSRTAGTALLIQAREFLGEDSGKMTNEQVLESIAQDRVAFKAFFEGGEHKGKKRKGLQMTITGPNGEEMSVSGDRASFERQAVPVLKSMLTPGTQEYANWKSATKGMGSIGTTEQDWMTKKAELDASQLKKTIDKSNKAEAAAQATRSEMTTDARWAAAYKDIESNAQALGFDFIERFAAARSMDYKQYFGAQTPEMAYEEVLKSYQGMVTNGSERSQALRSPEQQQVIVDKLQELIDISRGQLKEAEKKPINRNGQAE